MLVLRKVTGGYDAGGGREVAPVTALPPWTGPTFGKDSARRQAVQLVGDQGWRYLLNARAGLP